MSIHCHICNNRELGLFKLEIYSDPEVKLDHKIKRLRQANFKMQYKQRLHVSLAHLSEFLSATFSLLCLVLLSVFLSSAFSLLYQLQSTSRKKRLHFLHVMHMICMQLLYSSEHARNAL